MNRMTTIITTTAVAAVTSAGLAAAAEAPSVSAQRTSAARTAPLTIPGMGLQRGERLPRGARIVYRDVALAKGQKVRFTLRAPHGKTLRGLAPRDGAVGFAVVSRGSYVGRRSVSVRAFTAPRSSAGEHTGRIYALVR